MQSGADYMLKLASCSWLSYFEAEKADYNVELRLQPMIIFICCLEYSFVVHREWKIVFDSTYHVYKKDKQKNLCYTKVTKTNWW